MLRIIIFAFTALNLLGSTLCHERETVTRSFLVDLQKNHHQIKKTQTGLCQFNSAATYIPAWKKVDDIITYFTNTESFISDYKTAPLFQKRVACSILRSLVETIDATIKTVKASPSFSFDQKFSHIHTMISRFCELWICWAEQLMSSSALRYHPQWSLEKYSKKIIYFLNRKKDHYTFDSEFKKSSSFSVQAAVLGSATAFERHYPATLEDLFMLVHQNSLAVIAALFNDTLCNQTLNDLVSMPSIAQELSTKLESSSFAPHARDFFGHHLKPQRIGLRYSNDTIEIMYNMSLRNHSSTLQLIVETQTQDCFLAVQFVGNARSRWEEILLCAAISEHVSGLTLKDQIVFDYSAGLVSFTWQVDKQSQIELIESYLTLMADISYGRKLSLSRLRCIKNMPKTINDALDIIQKKYGSVGSLYSLYAY
jgi:hypothetical protein